MEKAIAKVPELPQMLAMKNTVQKFEEILKGRTASFIASLLTIWRDDEKLKDCDTVTILSAAKQAAILNLPIMKQLGYAYIIPYKDWRTGKYMAQFQLGYKGYLQLAMRSGVFKNLNSVEIYEGEIKSRNRITGEIELDENAPTTGKVIGYVAYMELTNGFEKMLYMTREEMESHAQKYSQSYSYDLKNNKKSSVWTTNFDAMAKKTVLKLLLSRYAPTSIEMQNNELTQALKADQAVVTPEGEYQYLDNEPLAQVVEVEETEKPAEDIEVPFD